MISSFRRNILLNMSKMDIYTAKFKLKFEDLNDNNIIDITEGVRTYGIGFMLRSQEIPDLSSFVGEPLPVVNDVNMILTVKKDNKVLYKYSEVTKAGVKVWLNLYIIKGKGENEIDPNNQTKLYFEDLVNGIYDIELKFTSREFLGKPESIFAKESKYIKIFSIESTEPGPGGDTKSSKDYPCNCLYSIEEVKPDPELTGKGIVISIGEWQ